MFDTWPHPGLHEYGVHKMDAFICFGIALQQFDPFMHL